MHRRSLLSAAITALTVMPVAALTAPAPPATAAPGAPSAAYVPLPSPTRLLDTRGGAALGGGSVRSVPITGAAPLPLPGQVTAAVLNVTVVGRAGAGYWTIWPHDGSRPNASNLNVDDQAALRGDALAVANLVTVPVGPSGIVDVFSEQGGNLIVDMLGYYAAAAEASAGRFEPLAVPQRIVDTRASGAFLAPGETRPVRAPGAGGASAVVVNVTTVAAGGGYWTAFPTGSPLPEASNLNSAGLGDVVANQAIVPVDDNGEFQVYSSGGGHLIVDILGTFTGPGAPTGTDGLFVALDAPTRLFDSRVEGLNPAGTTRQLLPRWNVEVPITSNPAIGRPDVGAVVVNVTTLDGFDAGYLSATPAGSNDPAVKSRLTSTLNVVRPAQTLANHATVPVSSRGIDLYADAGGHVIVDAAGFYLGTPSAPAYGTPQNSDPTPAGCAGFPAAAAGPITKGSDGASVAAVQNRLLALGFWLSAADGSYGLTTTQAVMAFQFWSGLPPTGVTDATTAAKLNTTLCRPATSVLGTDFFEVSKSRQIAFIVRGGQVQWVFHVSTGNGRNYDEPNRKVQGGREIGVAVTPSGDFKIYRVSDEARYEGTLGTMYRPRFFSGGVAVHGAGNVPNYPASHGCVRVTNPAMDMIWSSNALAMGARVVVHE